MILCQHYFERSVVDFHKVYEFESELLIDEFYEEAIWWPYFVIFVYIYLLDFDYIMDCYYFILYYGDIT